VLAQDAGPHPWIADAPSEFLRLIDMGNVEIKVDDQRVRNARKSAVTLFQFSVKYNFKYRIEWATRTSNRDPWHASIVAWSDQPQVRLDHQVCLLSNFMPINPWQSKLLRHEFDHVAISTDPRLTKLMKQMLQRRRKITSIWEQFETPSEADVRQRVQKEFDDDVQSIQSLIQRQYDELDGQSNEGSAEIANRKKFFIDLYSPDGLERCGFPLSTDTRSFIKDKLSGASALTEVDKHYVSILP
jgi:hypothetical protein